MTLLVEAGLGFYRMRKGEGTNLNGLTQVHFPSSVAVTLVGITGEIFGPWATYSMSLLSYYPKNGQNISSETCFCKLCDLLLVKVRRQGP